MSESDAPGPAPTAADRALRMLCPQRRIAMLSVHTCPLAAPGGKQTGGMNVYVRELMRELGRRGYKVDAFTRSESADIPHVADTDLGPNVRVIHIVAGDEHPVSKDDIWTERHAFVEGVLDFMAMEAIRYDLYHSHYWMSGWVAREIQARHPAPIVHMFHTLGALKELARGEHEPAEVGERVAVEADIMDFADVLVAATPIDCQHMVTHYGADPRKVQIIPPGVDLNVFKPLPRDEVFASLEQDPCHRVILFVGRMDPIKGLDTLMRALAQVLARDPDLAEHACLCVVGGDKIDTDPQWLSEEQARIDTLARELGLEGFVNYLGSLPQDLLRLWYNAAEVVVVPSRYESFGMVALEAMATGTPVIASDVGGLSTLVRDGRTGFLVPDDDPDALAAKLLPVLALPEIHDTLGEHGVATAAGYGWPSIAERIDELYDRVLGPALLARDS